MTLSVLGPLGLGCLFKGSLKGSTEAPFKGSLIDPLKEPFIDPLWKLGL